MTEKYLTVKCTELNYNIYIILLVYTRGKMMSHFATNSKSFFDFI